jgi:vancomycin permeability regulator SanA
VVDRLLLSGDNRTADYNEPAAMLRATLARGYDPDLIAVDYGGRRTWDSCKRAKEIFGVTHAVLITNDFHRNRTVAVCRAAGIHVDGAVGTPTADYPRSDRMSWQIRELGASWRAGLDIWINNPDAAVSGQPIDIFDPEQVRRSLTPEDRAPATNSYGR